MPVQKCGGNLLVQVELHDDAVAVAVGVGWVERAGGPAFAGAEVCVAVEAVCAQLAACAGRQEGHAGDDQRSERGHDFSGKVLSKSTAQCLLQKIRR